MQEVIYLARSIRNKNRVKNRQPLSSLKVALPDSSQNGIIGEFREVIAEELNVKNIEILDEAESIADVKYAPNFNEIRNRYPDRIGEIIKAVKSGRFRMEGDTVVLQTDNQGSFAVPKEATRWKEKEIFRMPENSLAVKLQIRFCLPWKERCQNNGWNIFVRKRWASWVTLQHRKASLKLRPKRGRR